MSNLFDFLQEPELDESQKQMRDTFDQILRADPNRGTYLLLGENTSPSAEMMEIAAHTGRGPGNLPNVAEESVNFMEGLGRSALHGLGPGLIGLDPSPDLAAWQSQNPWSSMAAEFLGSLLPYSIPFYGTGAIAAKVGTTAALKAAGGLGLFAASKTPVIRGLTTAAKNIATSHPGTSIMFRETARFLPLELSRVGVTAAINPAKFTDVAAEGALNLGLIGGASGLIGSFIRAAPLPGPLLQGEAKIEEVFGYWNRKASSQDKLKTLIQLDEQGFKFGRARTAVESVKKQAAVDILESHPIFGEEQLIRRLVGARPWADNRSKKLSKVFRQLGVTPDDLFIRRLGYKKAKKGFFQSQESLDEALARIGIGLHDLPYIKFLRHIETRSEKGHDDLIDLIRGRATEKGGRDGKGFIPVDVNARSGKRNSAWIAREANGLAVVIKRIKARPQSKKFGDQYIIFKTDDPKRFFPELAGFGESLERNAFALARKAERFDNTVDAPGLEFANSIMHAYPRDAFLGAVPEKVRGEAIARVLAKVSPKLEGIPENVMAGQNFLLDQIRGVAEVAINEFGPHPIAQRIWQLASQMVNRAEARATQDMLGIAQWKPTKSLLGLIFQIPGRVGSIKNAIDDVYKAGDEAVQQMFSSLYFEHTVREATEAGFDDTVLEVIDLLTKRSTRIQQELEATSIATGGKISKPMVETDARQAILWRGTFRAPVYVRGDRSQVVGVGTGFSRQQAINEAEALMATAEKRSGGRLQYETHSDPATVKRQGREQDLELQSQVAEHTRSPDAPERRATPAERAAMDTIEPPVTPEGMVPSRRQKQIQEAKEAAGKLSTGHVEGLVAARREIFLEPENFTKFGELAIGKPLHKKEFQEAIYGNFIETHRMIANAIVKYRFADDIKLVMEEMPELGARLNDRLRRLQGKPGKIAAMMDEAINKTLAPIMGNSSAAEIVRSANRAMFTLTLGAGDVGFVMLNALTPIQTVLPEIAYTLTTPGRRLMQSYDATTIMGRTGQLDTVFSLSPIKIMAQTMKDIFHPNPKLTAMIKEALENRVIDKKLIEEFVGQNAELARNLKGVFTGDQGFVEWITALSEFGPGKSEEFSRLVAFVTGHNIGRDFFMLKEGSESLFNFASQFTNRTMYLYSTADRPRIITGALGSFAGLFKNWSFHYISNMMRYGTEAFAHQNYAPLLWMFAGTGMVAGAGGIPLYGVAETFFKSQQPIASKKGIAQAVYEATDGTVPERIIDSMFYGIPAFLGVSLQGRAEAPGSDLYFNINQMMSVAAAQRMISLQRGLGDVIDSWRATGQHPIRNQKVFDAFYQAFAPRTMYRWQSFTEDEAYRSLKTGNRLFQSSGLERLSFSTGINTTHFEKEFEASETLWSRQDKMREAIRVAGNAMAEAMQEGDVSTQHAILDRAIQRGLPLDSIMRSAKSNMLKESEDLIDRQFKAYSVEQVRRAFDLPY